MSRIAKSPVEVPQGVEVTLDDRRVTVKGAKGELSMTLNELVNFEQNEGVVQLTPVDNSQEAWAQAGTARSVINNMVVGVTEGFQRKLILNGVGYRAQMQGNVLNLTLGLSHPVNYELPEGVEVEMPSNTEVVIKGTDKQLVGQVAAKVRGFRPPEPYKGKGIRFEDETLRLKEAKKK
jgi:large subunit ribosomal protein L6